MPFFPCPAPAAPAQEPPSAGATPASHYALYPLAPNTKWTYHQRQENGDGVRFNEADAKLAKGNVLEVEVVSEVKGTEAFGRHRYTRVESVKAGRLVLTEWFRVGSGVLFLGRTVDSDTGQRTDMAPPQKLLAAKMKAGESWTWKASDAPVTMRTTVIGPAQVSVPAGLFNSTQLVHEMTVDLGDAVITVRQARWFVPGIGYVKQQTETRAAGRILSRSALDLVRFEEPRPAK
jgi:hypothetical protein